MKPQKPVITKSDELWRKAIEIIPAGTQTFSKGPSQFVDGVSPKYLERGDGCYVWDVDGNRYIDFIMGCHPIVLGYNDPDVNHAIVEQLQKGIVFSLMNPLEIEVTERLIAMIPSAEAVRFGKNGADATSAAVRVARAYTGREHVAYCGYHGWHDWYIANTDLNLGVPKFNQGLAHSFNYNDLDSLIRIFEEHSDDIACVIMEPLTVLKPAPRFLESVKEVAHHYGSLLVFDEIITGFRFAEGGAQELVGVTPDLSCFAKGLSNGMPLSAVVGRKEYMFSLEKTFFSFTYAGECLSLAAAKATVDKIRREHVIEHLWKVGEQLQNGYNQIARDCGVAEFTECIGYPCRSVLTFNGLGQFDELEIKSLFQQELVKRGVLATGYHAICYSHTRTEIDHTLEAYQDAFKKFRLIINGGQRIRDHLDGQSIRPVFRKVEDFLSYTTRRG